MTLLDALTILRGVAGLSSQVATRQGKAALKVVDQKIRSLQRKKAWRDCSAGSMPPHATDPHHPLDKGFKWESQPDSGFPNVVPMWAPPPKNPSSTD